MTRREEEIRQAAKEFKYHSGDYGFIEGAEWADKHPESKYNISDIDYVKLMLEDILNTAERVTSGNISHNIASIKLEAKLALNTFTKL